MILLSRGSKKLTSLVSLKYNTLASPGIQEDRADYSLALFPHFFFSMKKNLIRDARVKAKLSLREAVVESKKHDDEAEGLSLTTLARLEKQEGKKPLHPRTARILSKMYEIGYDDLYL